jgi:hypothetical protein
MLKKAKSFDNSWLGVIIGIIGPIIGYFVVVNFVYQFEFADKSLHNSLMNLVVPKVISIGSIPNLLFFFLFIYTNRLRSARGVLGATIFYAVVVLIMKLVL